MQLHTNAISFSFRTCTRNGNLGVEPKLLLNCDEFPFFPRWCRIHMTWEHTYMTVKHSPVPCTAQPLSQEHLHPSINRSERLERPTNYNVPDEESDFSQASIRVSFHSSWLVPSPDIIKSTNSQVLNIITWNTIFAVTREARLDFLVLVNAFFAPRDVF